MGHDRIVIASFINKMKLHALLKTSTDNLFLHYIKNNKQKYSIWNSTRFVNIEFILKAENKSKSMWTVFKDELGLCKLLIEKY